MTHRFEVQIKPEMMRRAWNAWFFSGRRWGRLGVASLRLLAAIFMDARDGNLGNQSVVSATIFGIAILVYAVAYIVGVRRALHKLEMIVDGKASYTLTDDTIEARSSLGSYALSWSVVSEVRETRDLVLLAIWGGTYSTIPKAQIPGQAHAFLLERVRANGGKVTAN